MVATAKIYDKCGEKNKRRATSALCEVRCKVEFINLAC